MKGSARVLLQMAMEFIAAAIRAWLGQESEPANRARRVFDKQSPLLEKAEADDKARQIIGEK